MKMIEKKVENGMENQWNKIYQKLEEVKRNEIM